MVIFSSLSMSQKELKENNSKEKNLGQNSQPESCYMRIYWVLVALVCFAVIGVRYGAELDAGDDRCLTADSKTAQPIFASEKVIDLFLARYRFAQDRIDHKKWSDFAKHLRPLSKETCVALLAKAPTADDGKPVMKLDGLQCVHGISTHANRDEKNSSKLIKTWEGRRGRQEPWINVLHGGPSPRNMFQQGGLVLRLLGIDRRMLSHETNLFSSAQKGARDINPRYVIVELGCGNGQVLFSMCPVDATNSIACFGADITAPLISDARSYFSHGAFEIGPRLSILPNGSATHVFSNGIMGLVEPTVGCEHILEGLRLLSTGGVFVVLMLGGEGGHWVTRLHPVFFNSSSISNATKPEEILEYCNLHLGVDFNRLVSRIEFLFEVQGEFLYAPNYLHRVFIARLFRSNVSLYGSLLNDKNELPFEYLPPLTKTLLETGQLEPIEQAFRIRHTRLLQMWLRHKRASRKERSQHIAWVDDNSAS